MLRIRLCIELQKNNVQNESCTLLADPAWFCLHIACQTFAHVIGVAGWATGLKLGSEASSVNQYDGHRNIGITLFCLGSLQVLHIFMHMH